jgi:glycosyltransferase involved in cell wall biosynthesis
VERARQTRRLLREDGGAAVTARILDRVATRLTPAGYRRIPVEREHLLAAAEMRSSGWDLPRPTRWSPGEPLTVAWVTVPPNPIAGGHNTMMRMVEALERKGHTCVLYLYDRHGWSLDGHVRTVREGWPSVRAEVRDLAAGIEDSHVVFATSWMSAYPVLASRALGTRCYFVQDFEPSFYPAGSEALLAEATYRFGFHGVTAGRWLALKLAREYGMPAAHFDFGCDLDRYQLDTSPEGERKRTGVCCYCRPSTPRRGYELAMMALELLAARHPDIDIHLFGQTAGRLGFSAINHGPLSAEQLSRLYNECVAGLCLSATNVSLVPHEMLAAGCIPVVNDAEHNRVVLDNEHVVYVPPTPFHLADALSSLLTRSEPDRTGAARAAAASVGTHTWSDSGEQFERVVRGIVETYAMEAIAA